MNFILFIFRHSIRHPKRLDGVPSHAILLTRFRYMIPPNTAADFGLIFA